MHSFKSFSLGLFLCLAAVGNAADPEAIYDGGYGGEAVVLLRIGNGGAGQSGLAKGMLQLLCYCY